MINKIRIKNIYKFLELLLFKIIQLMVIIIMMFKFQILKTPQISLKTKKIIIIPILKPTLVIIKIRKVILI